MKFPPFSVENLYASITQIEAAHEEITTRSLRLSFQRWPSPISSNGARENKNCDLPRIDWKARSAGP